VDALWMRLTMSCNLPSFRSSLNLYLCNSERLPWLRGHDWSNRLSVIRRLEKKCLACASRGTTLILLGPLRRALSL
jgi:hypothetical protein